MIPPKICATVCANIPELAILACLYLILFYIPYFSKSCGFYHGTQACLLKIIYERYPSIRVLVLSAFLDEAFVVQCLQYGINGYLVKSMEFCEILRAIEFAAKNEVYYTNLLCHSFFKKYLVQYKKSGDYLLPEFTMEEIKMLELLRDERSTSEISTVMNMSKRTVEVKRDRMREKANAKTVSGLLLYSLNRGLID